MPLEFNEAVQTGEQSTHPDQIGSHELVTSETNLEALSEEARLCEELVAYMSRRNKTVARGACTILGAVVSMMVVAIFGLPLPPDLNALLDRNGLLLHALQCILLAAVSCIALSGGWLLFTAWNRNARRKTERLRECATLDASSTLVRLLGVDDVKVRHCAEQALLQIVPFWGEEQFAAFSEKERRRIRMAIASADLNPWRRPDFERYFPLSTELRIALCRRIAWFGNQDDLQSLKFAQRIPALVSGQRRIREAAKEAIPILEARLAEQNRPHTLLRASTTPHAQPDELMRAAGASSAAPAEELLRPEG